MQYEKIPQPPPYPLLGNILDINLQALTQSLMRLAKQYGPIVKLDLGVVRYVFLSSQELVNEVSDETRFQKYVSGPLNEVRAFTGDGLFTAATTEKNWGIAHRILSSAFGPIAIRNMFGGMIDIAEQMILKWERFGETTVINVSENFTRLTLDTIALCSFNYRFNSFYQNEMHPFVDCMVRALIEAGNRSLRLPIQTKLMYKTQRQYFNDIQYMHDLADKLVAERKKNGTGNTKDFLDILLTTKDPITGEQLSDENIRYQMVTFLIAGHETTSGMLSFAVYELLKNPKALHTAIEEVDRVLGTGPLTVEHLPKLVYIDQVLKETLRLWPTAPGYDVYSDKDEIIGGKYQVKKGETISILLPTLHRDPKVWGNNAEEFDPDRFSADKISKLPPNSYKPFGNGSRSCIGRAFAMQEAIIVLALILQRFELLENDPSYQLEIKESLTMKPDNFFIRVRRRNSAVIPSPISSVVHKPAAALTNASPINVSMATPLLVLFGSNSGSCESFASQIASDSQRYGYAATFAPLDKYTGQLPTTGAVIIVAASYEGNPTDNAKQFVSWLDTLTSNSLNGVKYAVFGCGNRDWFRTYQAIPTKIDERLSECGAVRLTKRGEADAKGDFFGDFDRWYSSLWENVAKGIGHVNTTSSTKRNQYNVEVVKETRPILLRQTDLQCGEVVENREITMATTRTKLHMEVALPKGVTYRSGDYLIVLPVNPNQTVDRVIKHFGFDRETKIVIHKSTDQQTFLPTGHNISVVELLSNYVELSHPATMKQIEQLVEFTQCPPDKMRLKSFIDDEGTYKSKIFEKRVSVLDLLSQFPSCEISFGLFLEMLPPLKPRQFSISSSPLWNPNHCTITFSVLDSPSWSTVGQHKGVTSNYLASTSVGSKITVTVRPSNYFHLPESPLTPIIMIGAGTGIAPFRGFIQERATQLLNGQQIGEALLFFGCTNPDKDYLYKDELSNWEKVGAVKVRNAYSQVEGAEAKYVQHKLWNDRLEVMSLVEKNAKIFVCGEATKMAPAVRSTFMEMYKELSNCSNQEAEKWISDLELVSLNYVVDIFS